MFRTIRAMSLETRIRFGTHDHKEVAGVAAGLGAALTAPGDAQRHPGATFGRGVTRPVRESPALRADFVSA